MANRLETHVYFFGEGWNIYTERPADIRRFTDWYGKPTRLGREGACASWEGLSPDALRIRRKAKRGSRIAVSGASARSVRPTSPR